MPVMWGLKFFLNVISGIKDNKLISINLQVIIRLFIATPKIEEDTSIKINNLFLNQEILKENFNYQRVMSPSAYLAYSFNYC